MNGVVEILIDDQIHTLRFGVQACMLFQDMSALSAKAKIDALKAKGSEIDLLVLNTRENEIKTMGDLFYCGLYGSALRAQRQPLSYEQAMDLFDQFGEQKTFNDDMQRIWNTWQESRLGSQLVEAGKAALALKKKVEELESQL